MRVNQPLFGSIIDILAEYAFDAGLFSMTSPDSTYLQKARRISRCKIARRGGLAIASLAAVEASAELSIGVADVYLSASGAEQFNTAVPGATVGSSALSGLSRKFYGEANGITGALMNATGDMGNASSYVEFFWSGDYSGAVSDTDVFSLDYDFDITLTGDANQFAEWYMYWEFSGDLFFSSSASSDSSFDGPGVYQVDGSIELGSDFSANAAATGDWKLVLNVNYFPAMLSDTLSVEIPENSIDFVQTIPEPSAALPIGVMLAGVFLARRKHQLG